VFLRIEPLERGGGFEFVDAVKGGTIPGPVHPAVEKGVRQVLHGGAIAGYQLQDVRVTVYDGKYHTVDSKEVAFVAAGKKAFPRRDRQGAAADLEPIVDLAVTRPRRTWATSPAGSRPSARASAAPIRRARARSMISAQVPLSELTTTPPNSRARPRGRGRYDLEFSHYEPGAGRRCRSSWSRAYKPHHDED
jgi:elongation factor G